MNQNQLLVTKSPKTSRAVTCTGGCAQSPTDDRVSLPLLARLTHLARLAQLSSPIL